MTAGVTHTRKRETCRTGKMHGVEPGDADSSRSLRFAEGTGALLWGLAEATFFFIVPDVLISMVAARGRLRASLMAALLALAGARAGGWLMYSWGAGAPVKIVYTYLDAVPAVSHGMIERAYEAMLEQEAWAVLWGPLSGTPYKIYAALAPHAGVSPGTFLMISVPARLGRFLLAGLAAFMLRRALRRFLPQLDPLWAWGGFWIVFYGLWFALMQG